MCVVFFNCYVTTIAYTDESTVENNSDADESSSDSEKTPKGEDSLLWDYFDTVPKCVSGVLLFCVVCGHWML